MQKQLTILGNDFHPLAATAHIIQPRPKQMSHCQMVASNPFTILEYGMGSLMIVKWHHLQQTIKCSMASWDYCVQDLYLSDSLLIYIHFS